jgi:hypothetical protein
MDEMISMLIAAYQGMTAGEVHADMQESGADQMFADSWMVANYLAHVASSA